MGLKPRDVLPAAPKNIEDHKIIKYPIHILHTLLKVKSVKSKTIPFLLQVMTSEFKTI